MDLLVNYGIRASSLAPSFGTYELLYEETVAHNKTQIDITGLNIGKDDGLRLVYNFVGSSTAINVLWSIFANDNNTSTNYYNQYLRGNGTSISAARANNSIFSFAGSDRKTAGFADIKVSNNDRFVCQSQFIDRIGSQNSAKSQWNFNIVGTQTVSSITKLSILAEAGNQIASGSRIALYRISGGGV